MTNQELLNDCFMRNKVVLIISEELKPTRVEKKNKVTWIECMSMMKIREGCKKFTIEEVIQHKNGTITFKMKNKNTKKGRAHMHFSNT